MKAALTHPLQTLLQNLTLSTFAANCYPVAEEFEREKKSNIDYLQELAIRETEHRYQQRIKRLLKQAKLPRNKLLKDFEVQRIIGLSITTIQQLAKGDFIDRYENILIFGNSGSGKTHLTIALGKEWCLLGRKVYYVTASNLVQQLLQAKLKLSIDSGHNAWALFRDNYSSAVDEWKKDNKELHGNSTPAVSLTPNIYGTTVHPHTLRRDNHSLLLLGNRNNTTTISSSSYASPYSFPASTTETTYTTSLQDITENEIPYRATTWYGNTYTYKYRR